ncbi:MAG: MerR family transcriptional regulator [Planctomycetota bacterium]
MMGKRPATHATPEDLDVDALIDPAADLANPGDPDIVPPPGAPAPAAPKGLSIRDYLLEACRIIQEMVPAQSRFNVSDLPDGRTLRYYQTLGLIDRPVRYNGRSVYLQRHLLQLVAVKLLQADQYTLSKIQQLLTEADDRGLREIIRRRAGTLDSLLEPPNAEAGASSATPASAAASAAAGAAGDAQADELAPEDPVNSPLLRRVMLGHGVEVTIEDGRRFSRQRCMELARKLHALLLRSSGWTGLEALARKPADGLGSTGAARLDDGADDEADETDEEGEDPRAARA